MHPNIPNCVTAPTTLNCIPNLFCNNDDNTIYDNIIKEITIETFWL